MTEERQQPSIGHVEGTLRAPVSSELRRNVEGLIGQGVRRIRLDLSRLSEIDAAGVGELVRAFNSTSAAGGVLQVAHVTRRVRQLLDVTRVLKLLTRGVKE